MGVNKAESIKRALAGEIKSNYLCRRFKTKFSPGLNSSVSAVPFSVSMDSSNALDIIRGFDVVLDCTDNVATRYLLNDACVLAGKPLVSGSALRFEGQLTVYNYKGTGPTYR